VVETAEASCVSRVRLRRPSAWFRGVFVVETAEASCVSRVRLRRPSAWFRQLSWLNSLLADRDLIVPKSVSSTYFRARGWAAWRALRREACGASRAPERAAELLGARLCAEACGASRAPERRAAACLALACAPRRAALRAHRRRSMRLNCLALASARGVRRFARTGEERKRRRDENAAERLTRSWRALHLAGVGLKAVSLGRLDVKVLHPNHDQTLGNRLDERRMRLNCLARAGARACGASRAPERERSAELLGARWGARHCGAARAPERAC
jgi:hypothetical protein